MFIFILLLVAGAAGGGFYWYTNKKNECQKEYDNRFSKIRQEFNRKTVESNYYNNMGECILQTDRIVDDMQGMFPKFILSKVQINYDGIHAMYKDLLHKLYFEYEKAFSNHADYKITLELIKKMQQSIRFINNKDICTITITDNRIKTQKYFNAVQHRLSCEFSELLVLNSPIIDVCNKLKNMLDAQKFVDYTMDSSFNRVINENFDLVRSHFIAIQQMLDTNFKNIAYEFLEKTNYDSIISTIQTIINDNQIFSSAFSNYGVRPEDNSNQIAYMTNILEKFIKLYDCVENADDCYMISDYEYGKNEKDFFNDVSSANTEQIMSNIDLLYTAFEHGDFELITSVDLNALAAQVWHYAMLKPFVLENFEKACRLYNGFFKSTYTAEILLAEIYYIKQMGGDSIIRSKITELLDEKNGKVREMIKYNVVIDKIGEDKYELRTALLKNTNITAEYADKIINGHTAIVREGISYSKASSLMYDLNRTGSMASITYHQNTSSKLLTTIASGLMWIGAYDSEKQILEYMLSKQLPLSQKQQERLHSLNNGGGNAPKGYRVSSDNDRLYFDIASISWHDDEYKGFFENLAFEEKILSYSVAVRDDDKELLISRRIKLPELDIVLEKILKNFNEEYGDTVSVSIRSCCALSGNTEEKLMGILVQSSECPHLGVLVHMACIGKKFTIKFFTLFMPESQKIEEQRQQLISLHKKMSPSVTMWENSLKDTILIALQQLLNDLPSADTIVSNSDEIEF